MPLSDCDSMSKYVDPGVGKQLANVDEVHGVSDREEKGPIVSYRSAFVGDELGGVPEGILQSWVTKHVSKNVFSVDRVA